MSDAIEWFDETWDSESDTVDRPDGSYCYATIIYHGGLYHVEGIICRKGEEEHVNLRASRNIVAAKVKAEKWLTKQRNGL